MRFNACARANKCNEKRSHSVCLFCLSFLPQIQWLRSLGNCVLVIVVVVVAVRIAARNSAADTNGPIASGAASLNDYSDFRDYVTRPTRPSLVVVDDNESQRAASFFLGATFALLLFGSERATSKTTSKSSFSQTSGGAKANTTAHREERK